MDLVAAVQVELTLNADSIEAHETTTARRRHVVGVVEMLQLAPVGEDEHPDARSAGESEHELVFLGPREAHRVHFSTCGEGSVFPRTYAAVDAASEQALIQAPEQTNELLLQNRREEELPGEEHRKALRVAAQELVEQRSAAARVPHDEYRRSDRRSDESRKEQVVEQHAERVHRCD
jgi:hypothetical protein